MATRRKRLSFTRDCTHCGNPFHPWSPGQKTCCATCRNLARHAGKEESVSSAVQVCRNCGTSFQKPYYTACCNVTCSAQYDAQQRESIPDYFEPKQADEDQYDPTAAPPGSTEKIAVMRQRMEAGLPLHHSRDRADYAGVRSRIKAIT